MKNKKGSITGIFLYVFVMLGWFLGWILIDGIDNSLDEAYDQVMTGNDSYITAFSTFQARQTTFKRVTFWGGLVFINAVFIAGAYASRGEQFLRPS